MISVELSYSWYVALKTLHMVAAVVWVFFLFFAMELSQRLTDLLYIRKTLSMATVALVLTVLTAGVLFLNFASPGEGWLHIKILCFLILVILHMVFYAKLRAVEDGQATDVFFHPTLKSLPLVLFVAIVGLVVAQPF